MANVSIEGDVDVGRKHLRAARRMLRGLQKVLQSGGVESGGTHGYLSESVYCYVRVGIDVNTIHIVAASHGEDIEQLRLVERFVEPDFLSGTVLDGRIRNFPVADGAEARLELFRPTSECARLFEIPSGQQSVKRLAVEPYSPYTNELSSAGGAVVFSQYVKLKPTMYSGTMVKLVQFLMGYGKVDPKNLIYKRTLKPEKQNQFVAPPTEYEKSTSRYGHQVRYGWHFHRTHGLVKSVDGKWWVVQIQQGRGMHAMPVKLYRRTTTDEFRDKLVDMGDNAGLDVIDLFGGFPTGESLPGNKEELDAKVRAGMILEGGVASDVAGFYGASPYSPWMGWAFSASGREAHNTGYYYGDDGVQRGVHYSASFSIGAIDEVEKSGRADTLKRHIAKKAKEHPLRWEAAFFKIDRMTNSQVESFLRMRPEEAWSAVDNLVIAPMAQFSASMRRAGEGKIYWPTPISPQIKFYSPDVMGLLSHDMRPSFRQRKPPNCDTVMHVFFKEEELKYVKFYLGPTESKSSSENDFEECMYVGSWTSTISSGIHGVPAMFYTSDFDDREEMAETKTVTEIVGRDIGYTSVQFGDVITHPYISFLTRTKSFMLTSKTTSYETRSLRSSVCVPEGVREAYYYMVKDHRAGLSTSISYSYKSLADPYSYVGWRNLAGWTGFLPAGCTESACYQREDHPAGCGKVDDRHIEKESYNPGGCSDYADSGSWASVCQQIEPMVYHVELPSIPPVVEPPEDRATMKVWAITGGAAGPIKAVDVVVTGSQAFFIGGRWFRPSPDPESGSVDFIHMRQNGLGSSQSVVYSKDINEYLNGSVGSPGGDLVEGKNTTYIGVVNG